MRALSSAALLGTVLVHCCSCDRQHQAPVPELGELLIEFPGMPFQLDSGTEAGPFEMNYVLHRDTLEQLLALKGYRTAQLRSFHFIKADIELDGPMHGGMENLSLYITPPVNGASRLAQLNTAAAGSQRLELMINKVEAQEAVLRRSMEIQVSGTVLVSQTRPVAGIMALSGTAVVEH